MDILKSGELWVRIAILLGILLTYLFLHSKNVGWVTDIESWLSGLFSPKGKSLIKKIDAETVRELARAKELQKVLEAKKKLAKARAENTRLRREIAGVSEDNVGGSETAKPPVRKTIQMG